MKLRWDTVIGLVRGTPRNLVPDTSAKRRCWRLPPADFSAEIFKRKDDGNSS